MKYLFLILLLSGCNLAPVLEGDYVRNQKEVKEVLVTIKKKVSINAEMIDTVQNVEAPIAQVLARRNATEMAEWSKEPIDFTAPTGGSQMMNVLMGLVGLSGLGGAGAIKKIMTLTSTVKQVAVMSPEEGVKAAQERGIKV